jgi:P-type Ca2+ transporter type 2C
MSWHSIPVSEVLELLGSSKLGLSQIEAETRLLKNGPNELQDKKRKTMLQLFFEQFKEVMILILLVAAAVSAVMGDVSDTIVILVIVVFNAGIGFFQEYRAEKAVLALKQATVTSATVLRDGKINNLPDPRLVLGDVVLLEAGNAVPADLRIIESVNLRIEEAALTGESAAIDKISGHLTKDQLVLADQTNLAFKGTFVAYGRGAGVVVAIGMDTEIGRIAGMLHQDVTLTPLQQRMSAFSKKLSLMIAFICVVFFIAGWLRGEDVVKMLLTSISLAVAAIPEALPAVITISLALAARQMIRLKSLVRKLPAVETLGSVSYICTDKTGTLTKNKMSVTEVCLPGKCYSRSELAALSKEPAGLLLLYAFGLNNDVVKDAHNRLKGDGTEIALMEVATGLQVNRPDLIRLAEIPFDAERKLMTTFHDIDGRIISFTKGAPDLLLKRCLEGEFPDLPGQVERMAQKGERVMGFAYRYWDELPVNPQSYSHEQQLHYLGLAGIIDPPREEVVAAVAQCRAAGIVPVMITGDHILTANAIARQTGILISEEDLSVTGSQLAEMTADEFSAKVTKIKVYARVSPDQKLRIVTALQKAGNYVAMTGDGLNDAASLKAANIGIAMGITGTDVAKEAADIILLDDNFSSIVSAVKAGRRVYDNILKLIKYLLTTNSSEMLTLLLGPLLGMPVALLPIHILWINLISDGLPAIAMSFEGAEKDIMTRPPRPLNEDIFSGGRGMHMLWVGILMAGVAISMQSWAFRNGLHWQTIVFNVLCLSQMGHALSIRSERSTLTEIGLFSNKMMIWSVLLVLVLQTVITYVPTFQEIFHTQALSAKEFILVGAASSLVFLVVELQKVFVRNKQQGNRK